MAVVLVTVGMGRWPFDRLVRAAGALWPAHEVFVQRGTSAVEPACPNAAFVPFAELVARIEAADVVVTHAGNTVRLVQRAGKVPIAVARDPALGEMGNDHQVRYLRSEERRGGGGAVVALWDVEDLWRAIEAHGGARLDPQRIPPRADPASVADRLDALCARLLC